MKALLTVAALGWCMLAHAQIDSTYIMEVDRRVQAINAEEDYEIRTLENDEFLEYTTDGGGELMGFVKNGELVKMVQRVVLSSCVIITEYYLDRSRPIFVRDQGVEFAYVDSTASFDPSVQNVTMEGRFYYRDNDAAPVSLTGSTRCGGAQTKEWAAIHLDEVERLKGLLMR